MRGVQAILARGRAAWLVLVLVGCGTVAAETPEEIFERGNSAYEQGRYAEAAAAYETALKYSIRDPRVEYNLGNAEFRLGNLGRAILHYERARRMDPTDEDILANLEYARASCFDRVEPLELPAVVRWLRGLQDGLGPDRQAWAFLVLVWVTGALLVSALSSPGRFSAKFGWSLAGLVLAASLVGASWFSTLQRLEGSSLAVVLDEVVEVLAGPGENNPALFTVHEGLTLEIRAERADWIQVSLPNGLNGWIHDASVGRV